nr:MAG TPA: Invasion associated locus B (IalB) protein [Caudoviricetes sp.]DAJ01254.1 MAG TPA: Invasion associated locus B (IalB) protein [Caudoviricetes sp.]DAJ76664.1 MAG TPA: Invasion associated locus B (IalB) protein [Caudoviricetes sp.]DAL87180.1 MAG TPA: Invasion associated locus B (IalB) protein [Caudoviricetes sp.]DAO13194.1 MAG TPA: Invasion associated locus B (IalB) protein [Caudoviricetes sp.]
MGRGDWQVRCQPGLVDNRKSLNHTERKMPL